MCFRLLAPVVKDAASKSGPRLGRLSLNKVSLETPTFVAPASRGAVPHLSHDNLRDHTSIKGIYVALEDCKPLNPSPTYLLPPTTYHLPPTLRSTNCHPVVEKFPPNVPIYNHKGTLRAFTSTPSNSLLILSARRVPPVTTAASNTDHSLAILTSVGFRMLKVDDYFRGALHLRPDIVLGLSDLPQQAPGRHRAPRMVFRTEMWLNELINKAAALEAEGQGKIPIFAPLLPLDWEQQQWYVEYLKAQVSSLSGLALYDSSLAFNIPAKLEMLPRMSLDGPDNPHKVLQQVSWGVDLFNLAFITQLTDAGIALDFQFGGTDLTLPANAKEDQSKRPMAVDLWGAEYAADLEPLGMSCECYSCRKHHRAYVQHLLVAKEMTAWVLLQMFILHSPLYPPFTNCITSRHNTAAIDRFFTAIRESITQGTFEQDRLHFAGTYVDDLPEKTGQGPRLRGYQFKSEGGSGKKNPKSFSKFGAGGGLGGDKREALDEAMTPLRDKDLVEVGFAERLS